jgi:hypothetical protein
MKRTFGVLLVVATIASLVTLRGAAPAGALVSGQTVRVSVDASNGDANAESLDASAITPDGRYVVFESAASDIAPPDANSTWDLLVRDVETGTTTRASVALGGGDPDGASFSGSISANGRFVAFESGASNLVKNDTNGKIDVFVRDLVNHTTKRISVGLGGSEANGDSQTPVISDDGRWVAFESDASNLVTTDFNGTGDVFLADRTTGAITLVSAAGDVSANSNSYWPDVTAHADLVVFGSYASNLVANDTNNAPDIFVWSRATGTTSLVSVNVANGSANGKSWIPSIDASGDKVAFDSEASDIVANDNNNQRDVFVRDLGTGVTQRVSVGLTVPDGNDASFQPSISGDGRSVLFASNATNLTPDVSLRRNVFVRDLALGVTQKVSVNVSGGDPNGGSNARFPSALSSDGTVAAFESDASDLVSGDGNGETDVFVRRLLPHLSVGDVLVAEPKSGTVSAVFTATLSTPQPGPVAVDYATADGTATAPADYKATSGTLTIPAGSTSGQVKVTVKGDPTIDGDRTFFVALSNPNGAVIADSLGQGTVRDDFPVPTPWLAVGDSTVWEGDAKTTKATFTFTMSNPSPTDTTFQYVTADGTAIAPGDYTAKSASVTIPAGKMSATATISVKGETAVEGDETFALQIVASSVPSGLDLARDTGTGTIRNDD